MGHRRGTSKPVPRVAIIGCGLIGSGLDETRIGEVALTHAGACQKSTAVALVALCDADEIRVKTAGLRRGIQACYTDYQQLLANEPIDILSICTPTNTRYPVIKAALENGIRLIFCEKPLAYTLEEAQEIINLAERTGATIAVNYLRRWDPGIQKAASLLRENKIGAIQHVTAFYGKGLLNNGSHLIDLCHFFWGKPARQHSLRSRNDQFAAHDPTLDACLEYNTAAGDFPVYLISSDHRHFSIFELDILGTNGRIQISAKGEEISLHLVGDDPLFTGYKTLLPAQKIPSDLENALEYAVNELADIFHGNQQKPQCGLPEAMNALEVVHKLRMKAKESK